jgi:putative tryptophan/tyrosine transport system substrate-binding protein
MQFGQLRRREFITLLGGAAAWPLAAQAQQAAMPVIGFLGGGSAQSGRSYVAAFGQGLSQAGYADGRNVAIEYRYADGQYYKLPALADELVRYRVAVLVAWTPVAALAAKQATASIPIVFALGSDPVRDGLVANLNRPGSNITGATFFSNLLDAKRLDLFHRLVPDVHIVGLLLNPKNVEAELQKERTQEAARALGLQVVFAEASTEHEIDEAAASLIDKRAAALLIAGDAFLVAKANLILELAGRYAVPTSFTLRGPVVAGGLMSYGANQNDTLRQVGNYAGRILKGEKPSDLPVQQPTRFEYIINLKTAKALGLVIPESILSLADEVIE